MLNNRPLALLVALATFSVGAIAQTADPAAAGASSSTAQMQAAPITRGPAGAARRFIDTQPIPGVWVHADASSTVTTVSANKAGTTEIRLERGRADLTVHHPADNSEILVDLPGGQTSLLKDGLYTFNAETNTVRVLRGEAEVYPGASTNAKAIKIKEDHELSFTGSGNLKAVEADPRELASDLIPAAGREGYPPAAGYMAPGYGYGPYGDGYPAYPVYPYVAYGYPYFGYGYPFGFGLGFGYYGGFYGGRFGRR